MTSPPLYGRTDECPPRRRSLRKVGLTALAAERPPPSSATCLVRPQATLKSRRQHRKAGQRMRPASSSVQAEFSPGVEARDGDRDQLGLPVECESPAEVSSTRGSLGSIEPEWPRSEGHVVRAIPRSPHCTSQVNHAISGSGEVEGNFYATRERRATAHVLLAPGPGALATGSCHGGES
jgi:hypothetical protein